MLTDNERIAVKMLVNSIKSDRRIKDIATKRNNLEMIASLDGHESSIENALEELSYAGERYKEIFDFFKTMLEAETL